MQKGRSYMYYKYMYVYNTCVYVYIVTCIVIIVISILLYSLMNVRMINEDTCTYIKLEYGMRKMISRF